MKPGRPSSYTPELAAAICERLAAGESLRGICEDAGMPSDTSVRRWALADVDGFSSRYTQAREIGYDSLAEEAIRIADTPLRGTKTEVSEDGIKVTHDDMLGHRKLQVDTRKWFLSKLAPKKYGDRQEVHHSGSVDLATTILDARKRAGG